MIKHLFFSTIFIFSLLSLHSLEVIGYLPNYRMDHGLSINLGQDIFDFSTYSPGMIFQSSKERDNSAQAIEEYLTYAVATKRITQINYFRVSPSSHGEIDDSLLDSYQLAFLQRLKIIYGIKLVLTIGISSRYFIPAVSQASYRKNLAQNLIDICRSWGFDGVDFDWEFPSRNRDINRYIDLISQVKKLGLKSNPDFKVSVAVARLQRLTPSLFHVADKVNCMAYDFNGRHSTFDTAKEMVEYFIARYNVSPDKLYLGIPFYGRVADPKAKDYRHARSFKKLSEVYNLDVNSKSEVDGYFFNSKELIKKKVSYAKEKGLGGLFIWELGEDIWDQRSLINSFPILELE